MNEFTIEAIQRGIEHFEVATGTKPAQVTMTSSLMEELKCDPDFALCTEIEDPCAEYELRGVKLIVDDSLVNEARMS